MQSSSSHNQLTLFCLSHCLFPPCQLAVGRCWQWVSGGIGWSVGIGSCGMDVDVGTLHQVGYTGQMVGGQQVGEIENMEHR